MSTLFNIDKNNYNDQALVLSSIDSRRNAAFFAGSWSSLTSADGTFDSATSFVSSLDVSQIQSNFDTETIAVASALFYDGSPVSNNYALAELSDVSDVTSLTSQKSLRINLPPFIDLIFPEIITTFGLKIDSLLPEFTDYEGD